MLYYEYKKLLIKNKGFFIIVFFIILKIVLTMNVSYDNDFAIQKNPQAYNLYMEKYQGFLSPIKQNEIEFEYQETIRSREKIKQLQENLKSGEITLKDYELEASRQLKLFQDTKVIEVIYNQYHYAKQDPENRYMVDDRGWLVLLNNQLPDVLLVICIIFLTIIIFCQEYDYDIYLIIKTTPKGNINVFVSKVILGISIITVLSLVFSYIDWRTTEMLIGLKGGDYPIQSLRIFSESAYKISLADAFKLISVQRLLGCYLLFSILTILSVIIKKNINSLFVGLTSFFVPLIILYKNPIMYYLPLPYGLLNASRYLSGDIYTNKLSESGEYLRVISYEQINPTMLKLMVLGYFVEILIIIFLSLVLWSGYDPIKLIKHVAKDLKERVHIKLKHIILILVVVALAYVINFESSESTFEYQDDFIADTKLFSQNIESDEHIVSFDIEKQTIDLINKSNGNKIELLRDPFRDEYQVQGIFVNGDICYYMEKINGRGGFRVTAINLVDFSDKIVFSNIVSKDEQLLKSQQELIEDDMQSYLSFVINSQYLYCLDYDGNLTQFNLDTGNENIISTNIYLTCGFYYYNGDIYYVNSKRSLCKYVASENRSLPLSNVYTEEFSIGQDGLTYINLLNDNEIITIDID